MSSSPRASDRRGEPLASTWLPSREDRAYRLISVPDRIPVNRRLWWFSGLIGVVLILAVGIWVATPQSGRSMHVPAADSYLLTRGLSEDKSNATSAGSSGGVVSSPSDTAQTDAAEEHCSGFLCAVTQGVMNVHLPWMPTSTSTTTTTITYTSTSITSTSTSTTTSSTLTDTNTTTTTTKTKTITTTTTTTTLCHTAVVGDHCHSNVMSAMQNPQLYGLTRESTFEEFQELVSKDPDTQCHLPCECGIAKNGTHCWDSVTWALQKGIRAHPEWYSGLTPTSRFEDVQAHLHEFDKTANCPSPCVSSLWHTMTFFCFSIIRSTGYEADILRNQFEWKAGIFACDAQAVLCDKKMVLGWGPVGPVETIPFNPAKVGVSKDGTAANTLLFMRAWDTVKTSTDYANHDWTLKVDPDAVVIPDRLRPHLAPYTNKEVYVRNCNKYPGPGWPMMFGSIEIFSVQAIQTYFKGEDRCKTELNWQPWGEDYFMGHCLDHLQVGTSDDYGVVSDAVCMGVNCSDPWAAAFHPFKSTTKWMQCWKEVTGKDKLLTETAPAAAVFQNEETEGQKQKKLVWVKK